MNGGAPISGTKPVPPAPGVINLDDLLDVDVPAPADNDFFYFSAAVGLWKPRRIRHSELQDIGPNDHHARYTDVEAGAVAGPLIEVHRTTQVHVQPQPPASHGNPAHSPAFATEAALTSHAGIPSAHFSNVITITFVIDGSGSPITTGQKGHLEIPFACIITGWTIVADQLGSIVIDVWKDTYANFPPTVDDSITGSEKPTLSSAQKNQDLTLTTWTIAIAAKDILAFNVDSCTTITRIVLSLSVEKT